jgi:DNA polymerase III delta subunit
MRQVLEKGLPPVTLILGPSAFFRGEAVDLAVGAVTAASDMRRVDGTQETDGRELLDLRGGSLFGPGCCLVVRRGEGWLKQRGDDLPVVLEKMAGGCALVLELAKLDRRTKLAKALMKKGAAFEFRELYAEPYDRSRSPLEAELVGWVQQRARHLGVQLHPDAAYLVITAVGTDPAELVAEMARLRERVEGPGDSGPGSLASEALSAEDLRGALTCSFESTPFELADAVLGGDRKRAVRSLKAIFARGVRGRDGSAVERGGLFPFITSWLYRSLANAYEGRRLVDRGTSLADVPGQLGVRTFTERFREQVRSHSLAQLRLGLLALVDSQRQLRLDGEDPELVLERFIARWFGGVA